MPKATSTQSKISTAHKIAKILDCDPEDITPEVKARYLQSKIQDLENQSNISMYRQVKSMDNQQVLFKTMFNVR